MSISSLTVHAPASDDEAEHIISEAASAGRKLGVAGGGTRRGLGRPLQVDAEVSSRNLAGVTFYEPSELVVGAKTGTSLRDVEAVLAAEGQSLAFEPIDHRALFGSEGEPTIGGIAAINASGPSRVKVGAARDALLGVNFVNGKGERIRAGGRVMKNVTGLDLVKALCGSYGTLGFMTEVVFKVMPRPERSVTLVLKGRSDAEAIAALSTALGSPYEPNGVAHLPADVGDAVPRTLIRIEGFDDSVAHRFEALAAQLKDHGTASMIEGEDSTALWRSIRDVSPLAEPGDRAIWRVSTVPGKAVGLVSAIADRLDVRWFYDWGGGLVWLSTESATDAGAGVIRAALASVSGHATLVRAPEEVRGRVAVFQPIASPLMRLSAGLKQSFDPAGVFESGRMYAGV